jgi:hypothetical protein
VFPWAVDEHEPRCLQLWGPFPCPICARVLPLGRGSLLQHLKADGPAGCRVRFAEVAVQRRAPRDGDESKESKESKDSASGRESKRSSGSGESQPASDSGATAAASTSTNGGSSGPGSAAPASTSAGDDSKEGMMVAAAAASASSAAGMIGEVGLAQNQSVVIRYDATTLITFEALESTRLWSIRAICIDASKLDDGESCFWQHFRCWANRCCSELMNEDPEHKEDSRIRSITLRLIGKVRCRFLHSPFARFAPCVF